jgi:propionyl-CoA carboxylase alpha chain
MGEQAVTLASAVAYVSAGTVEFIVDRERNFYFLEMNTRLQVEHPVTELVTGIDLVEEMIRIAAGERLRLRQQDVTQTGWAVECRIYAEDPVRDFLPSVGRLTHYRPPAEANVGDITIRNDTGVVEGSEVSVYYDPMIAKLCAHAPSRAAATDAMADALDAFTLAGIRHNILFLSALMAHPRWREGRLSTGFIAEEFPDGFRGAEPGGRERIALAAIAIAAALAEQARFDVRANAAGKACDGDWVLALGRERLPVQVAADPSAPDAWTLTLQGAAPVAVKTDWRPGMRVWRGSMDGETVVAQVERHNHGLRVSRRGVSCSARLLTPRAAELDRLMPETDEADSVDALLCPMPGLVVSIAVSEGQKVEPGETLATVEAMKMENVLRADRQVTVARILARPGDSLAVDAVIMEFA